MEAVEVVRQAIEAYEAGGIEALARFYHPEAEIVGGPFMGPKGIYRGVPDALRSMMEVVRSNGQELTATTTDVRRGGTPDRVLVEGVVTSRSTTGRPGGAWHSWWVILVRDEQIARLEILHEASRALEAAGLSAKPSR
jgi:ketosteroid isomerase-like protein